MSSAVQTESRFILDAETARRLVAEYGTPLYVISEPALRNRIREYVTAFQSATPKCELTFASKANSTLAVLRIAYQEGCLIDVASEGELQAALRAGVPAAKCHLHGNNKSRAEIEFAVAQGINQIVVDNFEEIETLAEMGVTTPLVLRLAPGVDPVTNAKISTGQADTKFGFNIGNGAAEEAVRLCLNHNLNLVGYHCHVGSQLLDPTAQISGGEILATFAIDMKTRHGFAAQVLNVGGGLGVHYVGDDRPMSVQEYCQRLVAPIQAALAGSGIDPLLVQEPGRSLVGEAGITLYTVGVVKTVPSPKKGERTFVAVDGGLSDNPRPALYGSKYTVTHFPSRHRAVAENKLVTISGKHCETDMLFEDVPLPADVQKGDILQVLVTGAYNSSMASNYNRYPRPATALLRQDGRSSLIQRRDTWDEMFARETVPEDL